MNTLLVEHVQPFTPGDESASVTLVSPFGRIVVFCWPCSLKVGDLVENRLSALDVDAKVAYLSDWPEEEKEKLSREWFEKIDDQPYAYRGCGHMLDEIPGTIKVLGFHIDLDDTSLQGTVEFECLRLDL